MPEPSASSSQLSLVYTARGQSLVHPLPRGSTSIGTAVDNDMVIEGDGVQSHHAVVTLDGGELTLRDLFAGETAINDRPRTSGVLKPGDVLSLGNTRLRVLRVATTSRRTKRPDPKDDTTKRTNRRNLRGDTSSNSAQFRRPSSRRMASDGRRSSGPHSSGGRRRPSGDLSQDPPTASGSRRRSSRSTKDWLGELNGDPEETQGMRAAGAGRAVSNAETRELEERVKRLTSRLRKAETRARSAQERLKHLELELASRPEANDAGGGPSGHLELASLHKLCTSMVDEADLETVLELIADSLLSTFHADRSVLILTEEDGRNPLINVERVKGDPDARDGGGVDPEVLEQALYTRRPLIVEPQDGGGGGLAAPILRSGRTFGILYFERMGQPIASSDQQLMSVFATLACLIIQPLMSEELT